MNFTVYYIDDPAPEPKWFYDRSKFTLVKTEESRRNGELYLCSDGYIKKRLFDGKYRTKIPRELLLNSVKDGMKCCTACINEKPVGDFQNASSVRSNKPTNTCRYCRKLGTDSKKKTQNTRAKKRAFTEQRRLEIIKKSGGCVHENCFVNKHLSEMTDKEILSMFDFNHVDDKNKLQSLTNFSWFTNNRAKKFGFSNFKELWEAEAKKCNVLCVMHHRLFTKKQRLDNAQDIYNNN